VREDTLRDVERWWRSQLGVGDELWTTCTVQRRTGGEEDDRGWFVAWRQDGVHVVAPTAVAAERASSLRQLSAAELRRPELWRALARDLGAELVGPNVYRYLDQDPGPAPGVREVAPSQLHGLGMGVEPEDLWESGFDVHLDAPGVVAFATDGGGAVLTPVDGAPRNVALLVAPEARGRGVGTALGRAAASYAVRHHGWSRWRSADGNLASARAAQRIGFEVYAHQLALR
jgi:GNAT superfamily N-acetyltransferase